MNHGFSWRAVLVESGIDKNGRRWSPTLLRTSCHLFEGVPVHIDHFDRRPLQHGVGSVRDVVYDEAIAGLVARVAIGSLCVRGALLRLWRGNRLGNLGLSIFPYVKGSDLRPLPAHVGGGEGAVSVESIVFVESVDIVAFPAAGGRFLEPLD